MTRRSPALRRRPTRTVPATLAAVVLAGIGGISAVTAIVRLVNGAWPTPVREFGGFLTSTPWSGQPWLLVCIVAAVLGLIMIIAAVKPGQINAATLVLPDATGEGPETELVISRRAIARLAASRAELVDGVDSVRVGATARRVRVAVTTSTEHRDELQGSVAETVGSALTAAGVTPMPRVQVRASTKTLPT